MFNSLTTLNLWNSTKFDSDMSVYYLALMLAKAPNLKWVDIATLHYEESKARIIDVYVTQYNYYYKDGGRLSNGFQGHLGGTIEEGEENIVIFNQDYYTNLKTEICKIKKEVKRPVEILLFDQYQ